jgi:hypothetical protein
MNKFIMPFVECAGSEFTIVLLAQHPCCGDGGWHATTLNTAHKYVAARNSNESQMLWHVSDAVQVVVSYDKKETDRFIELADFIEQRLPGIAVEGNPDGAAPSGTFCIKDEDGAVLYERAPGTPLPTDASLLEMIARRFGDAGGGAGGPGVGCM